MQIETRRKPITPSPALAALPSVIGGPGSDFTEILGAMVPNATLEDTRSYLSLLFGDRVKESLVQSLNPLAEVEVESASAADARSTARHLSFNFNRVMAAGKVSHLLVTVQDATQRAKLMAELDQAKRGARDELEVYLQLMTKSRDSLRQFLSSAQTALESINARLRAASSQSTETYDAVVGFALRTIHRVKGEASALGLELFESAAHRFEQELATLRDSGSIKGDDMLQLTLHLDEFFKRLDLIESVLARMGSAGGNAPEQTPVQALIHSVTDLAKRAADKQGKSVDLIFHLEVLEGLPRETIAEMRDILLQLVRNAVTHGIEAPEERQRLGKPKYGMLRIACVAAADGFEFSVRDDGRGLLASRIREALLQKGSYREDEVAALSDRAVVMKIFEPGFSTTESPDFDSGRGVGLDIVRESVRKIGGKLALSTVPDQHTTFTIRFSKTPNPVMETAAAS